jgi:hypothetical protein
MAQPQIGMRLLSAFETGSEARRGIGSWIDYYNRRRPHSTFGGRTPDEVYATAEMDAGPTIFPWFAIYRRSSNPRPSKIAGIAFSIRAARVADCFAPAK